MGRRKNWGKSKKVFDRHGTSGHMTFEMSFRHPFRMVQKAAGHVSVGFR